MLRSKPYLSALVLAALLGIPISAVAYGFLALTQKLQTAIFEDLPGNLFTGTTPAWWPLPWLVLCGVLTGAVIRYLPGNAGHSPALGFHVGGGPPVDRDLPGVILAALATLSLGAVLGPEAPLIAIGGGLAALTVHLVNKEAPPMALTIMASAGSFAAISTLLGSPLLGAFLIMEAAGIGGVTLSLVALPGLLSSGIGALVFVGLDNWTGLGSFSLAITSVPPAVTPTIATMAWALVLGAAAAPIGWVIRVGRPVAAPARPSEQGAGDRGARTARRPDRDGLPADLRPQLHAGAVLRRGRPARPGGARRRLLRRHPDPARRVQGGGVLALAQRLPRRPGLPGPPDRRRARASRRRACPAWTSPPPSRSAIGAMCTTMLRLPLTATLLAVVLLGADGVVVTPPAIVAVVVAFVVTGVLPDPKDPLAVTAPA